MKEKFILRAAMLKVYDNGDLEEVLYYDSDYSSTDSDNLQRVLAEMYEVSNTSMLEECADDPEPYQAPEPA